MAKNLVIVESPSKAKTISKILGKNYTVTASVGHLRDLPKSKLGIDIENNFEPNYINIRGKGDIIKELRKQAKKNDNIFLATDPDREGEAISWHLSKILMLDENDPIRITFNEITKDAIKSAVKNPRPIDSSLVDAQQARRVLDRLVGYQISPLLWKKITKGLSAGRVQSVAVKLIYDRENEIEKFIPEEYWLINGIFGNEAEINARLEIEIIDGKEKKINKLDKNKTDKIMAVLEKCSEGKIYDVNIKKVTKNPPPPFITSTLQQEAIKRFNFTSKKTMSVAQQLYEGINIKGRGHIGLITYIRTDSFRVADTAKKSTAAFIEDKYGKKYVNINRKYSNKKKDTQDAHEAIRPTDINFTPEKTKEFLTNDQQKLYTAIWERYAASCMTSAKYDEYNLYIETEGYIFRYNDKNLIFDGFLKISNKNEEIKVFPEFKKADNIKVKQIIPEQKFTTPPPRYSEASLVKAMEDLGIGRPSTYSPTVSTIISRKYVSKEKNLFYITELGRLVTELLIENFNEIIDEKFTAALEEKLDEIETDGKDWKKIIADFYEKFSADLKEAEKNIKEVVIEDIVTDEICEKCGSNMVVKKGRYGDFLACPNYPDCKNTKNITEEKIEDKVTDEICEKCGANMVIKKGKYGDFLACPNYPDCKNTKMIAEEIGVRCPKCSNPIIKIKGNNGKVFYGCSNYPECDFRSWYEPVNEKCEKCGENKVIKFVNKKETVVCINKKCT